MVPTTLGAGRRLTTPLHHTTLVSLFLPSSSLLPNLIGHNLAKHPYSLSKFSIRDFSLRLHFRCI
ncbi:hypothetical protein H5410_022181, partial [Solanum commersonii]